MLDSYLCIALCCNGSFKCFPANQILFAFIPCLLTSPQRCKYERFADTGGAHDAHYV
jgi:hypothetical protein